MADVWTPEMGPGVYDFETGRFIPDAAPADQAEADPGALTPDGRTMADIWDAVHAEQGAHEFVHQGDDFGFGDLDGADAAAIAALMSGLDAPAEDAAASPPEPDPVEEATAPDAEQQPQAAPDVEQVRREAEAIAVLDALHKAVGDELKRRRTDSADLFAAASNAGAQKTIDIKLPTGEAVGTLNIAGGDIDVRWDQEAALAFTRANAPHNVYDVVSPRALEQADVVEFVKLMHPSMVREEVRPAYLTLLEKQMTDDGQVPGAGGQLFPVAKRVPVPSVGDVRLGWKRATKSTPAGRDRIAQAWREGQFAGLVEISPPPPTDE